MINDVDINYGIKKVQNILRDLRNNEKIKFSSVFLFKKVYNLRLEYESRDDYDYEIRNEKCERYDLCKCIIDNINDTNNSRYLLLEINPFLSSLIYQIIKNQNPNKTIEFYDGSPFIDDNNNNYLFKILSKIQNDAKTDKLIILQNLNQIHPFLYDLYDRNYIIKDEQKFSRIILDNFIQQLTPVNDCFRIIILVDRKFMDEVDLGFLSRFEKHKITFDKLLDIEQMKLLIDLIFYEINLKHYIKQTKINYELKDLLINYGKKEIGCMLYNIYLNYKKNDKEIRGDEIKEIKEKVYSKIVKMLCQDIIFILPDDNKIKQIYLDKKEYYNFEKYLIDNENKNYKISIIYTFSNITNDIKCSNNIKKFMISEIKSENELFYKIDEIININESNKISNKNNIIIQFEQINSNKIQFVRNFIDKYYKKGKYEKYKFILIIHIKRNFCSQSSQKNKTIHSIPELSQDVNQLFIDNLNAPDISIRDLMNKDIKRIIEENEDYFDLNREFNRDLIKFVYKEINQNKYEDNNCLNLDENNLMDEIEKYMDKGKDFKNEIIKKAKKLINNDDEVKRNGKYLIDKLIKMNYINENSIDLISCVLDYIKEVIFSKYFENIFKEDNNLLTTLKD